MIAQLADGTEMEFKVGQRLCGLSFRRVVMTFADVGPMQHPEAQRWLNDVVLTRLSPEGTAP